MKIEKLKAPLFRGPEGAGATNDWCIKGIKIDDESVSILLNSEDVLLLAENQTDLQCMLNVLGNWCNTNTFSINLRKSNIVHFRNPSKTKSNFVFKQSANRALGLLIAKTKAFGGLQYDAAVISYGAALWSIQL